VQPGEAVPRRDPRERVGPARQHRHPRHRQLRRASPPLRHRAAAHLSAEGTRRGQVPVRRPEDTRSLRIKCFKPTCSPAYLPLQFHLWRAKRSRRKAT
jgi:hypothetical protein